MKIMITFLFACLSLFPANLAFADQWGSRVMAECYDNLIGRDPEHMFVRVFYTEFGGGQLDAPDGQAEGVFSFEQLNRTPFSCVVNGKTVQFALEDYRSPRETGSCAQCQHTGFRLVVNGKVIWNAAAPESLGMPVFNGTIDLDMDAARICTAQRNSQSGEGLSGGDHWTLICRTVAY